MARSKKVYPSKQSRGGTSPKATDTSFGAPGNQHKSKKQYKSRDR